MKATQDDLTADDHLVENTEKVPEGDAGLPVPEQDPHWIPDSAVDEEGRPA